MLVCGCKLTKIVRHELKLTASIACLTRVVNKMEANVLLDYYYYHYYH